MKNVNVNLKKINDYEWEIPIGTIPNMNVSGRIFASEKLLEKIKQDKTLTQCAGVATLPGIYKYAITLPDGHQGYGFPIGGVAALDYEKGGISPGGVGYDINCGVRLIRTNISKDEMFEKIKELLEKLFEYVPSGLGSKGKTRIHSEKEFDKVLEKGAKWAVENGYGKKDDLKHLESEGCLDLASAEFISPNAKKRGMPQLGSLGSGNHFLEIQYVEKIYNEKVAKVFGLEEGKTTLMIHTGSRGLGHQVCSDYIRKIEQKFPEVIKKLPDRELVYAPAGTELAEKYLKSMSAAANYAWCNRQMILHWSRQAYEKVFEKSSEELGMDVVYDVAHNIAKIETHKIEGEMKKVYLHRKGATRAFGQEHPELPEVYRDVGQPVIIPGSMGTASYVLVGTNEGMEKSFGSTAHGAGRTMSRYAAKKKYSGETVKKELSEKNILVKAASKSGIAEEAPGAYKDIDEVVRVSDEAGIAKIVAKLRPIGVIKG